MSSKIYKIGFFGDNIWALNFLKKVQLVKNLKLSFICSRKKIDKEIKKFAKKNKIDFFSFKNINEKKNIQKIVSYNCDLLVSLSYDQIFKKDLLNIFRNRIINCHAGKLPNYRGRNVLNWVLINGEKNFFISVHIIDRNIDLGNLILKKKFVIKKNYNYKDLLEISYKECPKVLLKAIRIYFRSKNLNSFYKIQGRGKYYKKRVKGDEKLNIKKKNIEIFNFIRALTPPGPYARFLFKKKEYKIKKSKIINKKKLNNQRIFINKSKKHIDIDKYDGQIRLYY